MIRAVWELISDSVVEIAEESPKAESILPPKLIDIVEPVVLIETTEEEIEET